ncbi:MAG: hypothetical protein DRP06_01505 [Candidatus Aenigmatarchaeota archaeon]|nr:MAG: hypothetical protein DRP06_01505 [Candidatus Aenigmarchaeota archaeon]
MKEKTMFVIKPDGYFNREKIKEDISVYFEIIQTTLLDFDLELIDKLYPMDLGKSHYPALLEYMLEAPCELGIIQGESVIKYFFEFVGKYSDPRICAKNTLRYKYGGGVDSTKSGLLILKNAIHRSKSKEEFEYEFNLFKSYNII